MITLGIETSCDETACGLVDDKMRILANSVFSQADMHALYGGVVPEIASRAHLEKVSPILRAALDEAKLDPAQLDLIAFTRGPGLLGPLLVGSAFARGLASYLGKPAIGINHLEGHLATAFLEAPDLPLPFLCLVVSGGHTELCLVEEGLHCTVLGRTRDDAAGEAFDKSGKILGLGYPAGPVLSRLAEGGRSDFTAFPKALDRQDNLEFSFSGLKTSVLRYSQTHDANFLKENLHHVCASIESAIVEVLVKKSINALKTTHLDTLTVVGGVSANGRLRIRMGEEAQRNGFRVIFPRVDLSGDNGVMIAGIAQLRMNMGLLRFPASSRDLEVEPSLHW